MIPVLDEKQRVEIEAVSDLIKAGLCKRNLVLDDASGVW
jgi:isoleucyl-tRNA synthetase